MTRGISLFVAMTVLLMSASILGTACPGDDQSHPEEVCYDTVDEFTDAYVLACGGDYYDARAEILSVFRNCEGVAAIRDETSLYAECFPALDYMTCDQFANGPLPTACQSQILFP